MPTYSAPGSPDSQPGKIETDTHRTESAEKGWFPGITAVHDYVRRHIWAVAGGLALATAAGTTSACAPETSQQSEKLGLTHQALSEYENPKLAPFTQGNYETVVYGEQNGDNIDLYISSDRSGTIGGYDIFKTTSTDNGKTFSPPTPVPGVNSTDDDFAFTIATDSILEIKKAYVTSTRDHLADQLYTCDWDGATGSNCAKTENINSKDVLGIIFDPLHSTLIADADNKTWVRSYPIGTWDEAINCTDGTRIIGGPQVNGNEVLVSSWDSTKGPDAVDIKVASWDGFDCTSPLTDVNPFTGLTINTSAYDAGGIQIGDWFYWTSNYENPDYYKIYMAKQKAAPPIGGAGGMGGSGGAETGGAGGSGGVGGAETGGAGGSGGIVETGGTGGAVTGGTGGVETGGTGSAGETSTGGTETGGTPGTGGTETGTAGTGGVETEPQPCAYLVDKKDSSVGCDVSCSGSVANFEIRQGKCALTLKTNSGTLDIILSTLPGDTKSYGFAFGGGDLGAPDELNIDDYQNHGSGIVFNSGGLEAVMLGTAGDSRIVDPKTLTRKLTVREGQVKPSINGVPVETIPNGLIQPQTNGAPGYILYNPQTAAIVGSSWETPDDLEHISPKSSDDSGCSISTTPHSTDYNSPWALVGLAVAATAIKRRKSSGK